jgi:hypothetical protein
MSVTSTSRASWILVAVLGGLLAGIVAGPVLGSAGAPARVVQVTPGVDGEPREHTIAVTGSGEVTVVPDMATVQLGVLVERKNAKEAREAAASAMTKVVAALRALGIAERDIATVTVSLGPVYDWSGSTQKIRAWQLQNTVSITVRDLAKVSAVLDDSVIAGATTIQGITFDVSDRAASEQAAREAAMADAKAKATTLAGAAGVSITGVASISETVSTPVWYDRGYAMAAGESDASTPVLPGTTDVTITVSVVYLID